MTKTTTFDEVYSILPDGWLLRGEAALLYRTVNSTTGDILEVGSYKGRSTVLLGSTGRKVYAVDPFANFDTSDLTGDATHKIFLNNIASRGLSNVELFKMPIEQWVTRPVGFAYLDGDHTYEGTLAQIKKALECNPKAIAIHDVNDSGGGVEIKRAALKVLGNWKERVNRLAVWQLTPGIKYGLKELPK